MPPPPDLDDLLDPAGLLREGAAVPSLDRRDAYVVFVQIPDARLDLGALQRMAARFFGAKIGLGHPKRYGAAAPRTDVARLYWDAEDGASRGSRLAVGRPADRSDHDAAHAVEAEVGHRGLADLARRCPTVWLIAAEAPGPEGDRVSLGLAAVLASVGLGPVLDPEGELYGVRGARERLERAARRPYR